MAQTKPQHLQTGGLVYSTEQGRTCSDCRRALAQCVCKSAAKPYSGDGVVRISHETKGRKGKGVTLVRGAPVDSAELVKLAKELKALCGSGGTVKEGVIEVQGDHVERLIENMKARGWVVKRAGG